MINNHFMLFIKRLTRLTPTIFKKKSTLYLKLLIFNKRFRGCFEERETEHFSDLIEIYNHSESCPVHSWLSHSVAPFLTTDNTPFVNVLILHSAWLSCQIQVLYSLDHVHYSSHNIRIPFLTSGDRPVRCGSMHVSAWVKNSTSWTWFYVAFAAFIHPGQQGKTPSSIEHTR